MQLEQRINAFVALGEFLGQFSSSQAEMTPGVSANDMYFKRMLQQLKMAKVHNGWFTEDNLNFAFNSWSIALSRENIEQWTSKYDIQDSAPKTIAIVMAGNIPLVGFHDFVSVLITGNKVLAKLSTKDNQLLPLISEFLQAVEPQFRGLISFTEGRLENFDAVIATGSNNTAKYFDYYFGKYPSIIRKNRNSVAVLDGSETSEDLKSLANDIFKYFGLGCRNVSKMFVPKDYNFDAFFNAIFSWKEIINNTKYINNYDYNKAIYLMTGVELLDNEFLLLKQDKSYSSPIGVLFFERYDNLSKLKQNFLEEKSEIQCIVSQCNVDNEIGFGMTQSPDLWDYADNVDTVDFLLKLSQ